MKQYLKLVKFVLERGEEKEDRTGTGTLSVFGYQMRFNLLKGFPLVTTKKVHLKSIIHEVIWFLSGDTNVRYLQENGVSIWDEWADEQGNLGPVYGAQWRSWPDTRVISNDDARDLEKKGEFEHLGPIDENIDRMGYCYHGAVRRTIDQISNVIQTLKTNPDSRRIIVSAWNPALVDEMALPPCHALFQFYTSKLTVDERYTLYREKMDRWQLEINRRACDNPEDVLANMYTNLHIHPRIWFKNDESGHQQLDKEGIPRLKLSCQLYQRSADVGLGVPFNIASYALLTQMLAQVVGMAPGDFIWTGGDVHIYKNHIEGLKEQLTREPHKLPKLWLNPDVKELFAFTFDEIRVEGYTSHPHIKLEVAV